MKKIERKQTRDHITQMLRYEILSGSMKPGDELAQESIAEQLGLSRMPVREALQALEQEGFLVRLPNRHMQVARLAPDHVSHIFRAIAVMATELFSLVPAAAGESLPERETIQILSLLFRLPCASFQMYFAHSHLFCVWFQLPYGPFPIPCVLFRQFVALIHCFREELPPRSVSSRNPYGQSRKWNVPAQQQPFRSPLLYVLLPP